jgi:hypothetical protein
VDSVRKGEKFQNRIISGSSPRSNLSAFDDLRQRIYNFSASDKRKYRLPDIHVHDAAGIGVICAIEEQRLHAHGRAGEEAEVRAVSRKSGPERMGGTSVDLMAHGSEE